MPLHNFHGDAESEAEWSDMAQKLLHKLSSELEQSLQAAGITDHNYKDKALEAQAAGNMELARAIAYKYARPAAWDVLSPECYFL